MTLAFPSVIAVTQSWAHFLGQANTAPPGSVQNWHRCEAGAAGGPFYPLFGQGEEKDSL